MKTIILSTLAAAAVALSLSPAFADGAVLTGPQLYITPAQEPAAERPPVIAQGRYDHTLGVSDHAVQGREFRAVQHNTHWLRDGDDY
jgi:hypothetical protein